MYTLMAVHYSVGSRSFEWNACAHTTQTGKGSRVRAEKPFSTKKLLLVVAKYVHGNNECGKQKRSGESGKLPFQHDLHMGE